MSHDTEQGQALQKSAPKKAVATLLSFFVVAVALIGVMEPAAAQVAPLDVSAGSDYLETNASTNMLIIAGVLFTLAGLGVAIRWAKATFFS